ncbi:MAG TPA: FG-GAP-like repeat-containing protein [Allosphingosinicella sp.]|jgi:hypothetical protein
MVATTLRRGEIAIIGVDTEDNGTPNPARDSLTLILLAPIGAGTIIYITDRAWNGTAFAAASAGENTLTYTAATDLPAGTVITYTQAQLTAAGINLSDGGNDGIGTGETIYVYQGTDANTPKTFLHAVDIADSPNSGGLADTFDGNELLNTGLADGISAVSIGKDNAKFGTRLWNINKEDLFLQINNETDWNNNSNSPQPAVTATQPHTVAPDAVVFVAGSGASRGIAQLNLDGTHQSGIQAYAIQHALQFHSMLNHPSDLSFDPMNDAFFLVDSDINGTNRILQGKISDLLNTPGGEIPLTVLWTGPANVANGIRTLSIDVTNQKVYFDAGTTFNRINYNTANQTKTTLADLGPEHYITQMSINYTTGKVYLGNSVIDSVFTADAISKNQVFVGTINSTGTNAANSVAFTAIQWGAYGDTAIPGEGSPLGNGHWPVERGTIRGIEIDESTGNLYIVTGTVILDNDGNGPTKYFGGVWMYNPTSGVVTNLYTQNGTNGPVGLLYYIDVDPITGRYYVLDETGTNASNEDSGVWTGLLGVAGTPTLVGHVGNIDGLGGQGLEIQHAPTLTGSAAGGLAVTEISSAAASGETSRVVLYTGVTANELDINGGDELRGAVVRVSTNYVRETSVGAGHTAAQDLLTIGGNESGTIAASGITYSYNRATGTMTLSGSATVAEYKAALEMVLFSTSGDNITSYGAATTRVVKASVFDGLLYSDEISATVNVTGINDRPVNTVGAGITVIEDTTGRITSTPVNVITGISVYDVDSDPATQDIRVTLTVGTGTITIRTDVVGGLAAGDVTGNGSGTIVLIGTQNEINATLAATNGASMPNGLVYTPPANFNGATNLTVTTNDLGNNGNDPGSSGSGTNEEDADVKVITVTDVNDAPTVIDFTQDAATILEDTPGAGQSVSVLFGASFSDALDAQYHATNNPTGYTGDTFAGVAVTANASNANGVWEWSHNGSAWQAIGSVTLAAAKTFTTDTLFRFNPAANFNGVAPTLVVRLIESGGTITNNAVINTSTTGGQSLITTNAVTLSQTVTSVNDAPTIGALQGDNVAWREGDGVVRYDLGLNAVVGDVDSADFEGGTLTVTYTNGLPEDAYTINTAGNVSVVPDSGPGFGTSGKVSVGGVEIGSYTFGTAGFVFTFDADATPARVQDLVRALGYTNTAGDNPTPGVRNVSLTLTDNDGTANGGDQDVTVTSTVTVTGVNDRPSLSGFSPTATFLENDVNAAPVLLDADVSFSDPEGNFAGGTLTVSGLLSQDVVAIRSQGTGGGQISVSGTDVSYGNVVIGTVSGGNGATLSVTLNASATNAAVDALIQNLTYANASNTPTASRTLTLNVVDATGADLAVMSRYSAVTGTANPFDGVTLSDRSKPAFADLDGDGDLDALIGSGDGNLRAFRNNGSGTAFTEMTGGASGTNPFAGINIGGGRAAPSFVDLDGDGDLDAVVGGLGNINSGTSTLRAFLNNGPGVAVTELSGSANPFGALTLSTESSPTFVDLDGDGDLDALVGQSNGALRALRNNGIGNAFTEMTGGASGSNPFAALNFVSRSAPTAVDLDSDGDLDVVVGADNGTLRSFRNDGAGIFVELTSTANPFNGLVTSSQRSSAAFVDFDGDGDLDAISGNELGGINAFRNVAKGQQITVNVTAQNDAPSGLNDTLPLLEDAFRDLGTGSFNFSDPDGEQFGTVTITAVTGGTLWYDANGGDHADAVQVTLPATYNTMDLAGGSKLFFRPTANSSAPGTLAFTLTDPSGGQSAGNTLTFNVTAVNDAPMGADSSATVQDNATYVFKAADFSAGMTDPNDSPANSFAGVRITTLPPASAGVIYYDADGVGSGQPVAITAGQDFTLQDLTDGKLTFVPAANSGGTEPTFTFQVRDNGGTANSGVNLDPNPDTFTINIEQSDIPTEVGNDTGTVTENSTAEIDVLLNDSDPDGPALQVTHVAGQAISPGESVTLASGAKVTLNVNGKLTYDPQDAFDTKLTGAASGGKNTAADDIFSYTVTGGTTGQVTVTVNGVVSVGEKLVGDDGDNYYYLTDLGDDVVEGADGGEDTIETDQSLRGPPFDQMYILAANVENLIGTNAAGQGFYDNALDNTITLAGGNDLLALTGGGTDVVNAGGGDDFIYSGGTWSAGDEVHGGDGYDTIGFYEPSTITFGANSLSGVELLQFYSASLAGGPQTNYTVTMHNGNVAQGKTLMVTAGTLGASEVFTFDGSQELDGHFTVLAGGGNDMITGGSGRDYLDGRAGNDTVIGGIGRDTLNGGTGTDTLTGGADRDWFRFTSVNDSNTANGIDTITDFLVGASDERIDLSGIDANTKDGAAGDQAFTFIGTNVAFGNVAGELRVVEESGKWFVQGDVDGDGLADLIIQIGNGADIQLWASNHFIL